VTERGASGASDTSDASRTSQTSRTSDVGGRIHRLRAERGLSQRELAEPRYTAAFISSVEAGRRTPSGEALEHIAERLGVSVGELRTGRAADAGLQIDLALAEADAGQDVQVYARVASSAEATDAQRAHAYMELGHAALRAADSLPRQGDLTSAAAYFDQAAALLADALPPQRAEATVGRAAVVRQQGDSRYAAYLLTEARDDLLATGHPDPTALLALHVHLAVCHSELGDDQEAAAAAVAALELAGRADPARIADLHLTTARTLLDSGHLADAALALAQARRAWREDTLRPKLAWCHRARGRERGQVGDLVGAVADLGTAHDLFKASGQEAQQTDTAVELAELYLALGQPARATELIGFTPDEGRQSARVERLRALMADDDCAREQHFVQSIAVYRHTGPRNEFAKTVGELADLLTAQGRLDDAAETLRAGVADLQRLTRPERS
jgi:transcriptional regulator with XRE-family HTH domain